MKTVPWLFLVSGFVSTNLFPTVHAAGLNERIAVSSTAASDYHRDAEGNAGLKPEGYVFVEGNFFEGATKDRGLKSAAFADLTKVLATSLAEQKYFPVRSVDSADLVIVVHWGVSTIYEDPQKEMMLDDLRTALPAYNASIAATNFADPRDLNRISDSFQTAEQSSAYMLARNAMLLGYPRDLIDYGFTSGFGEDEKKTLRAELIEERYFVILIAFDRQSLKKDQKRKIRWVTRMSVRSPGNNFKEALPVLSQAGASVFGKPLDGLVHVKANLREGRVALGELKFLEVVPESEHPHGDRKRK